MARALFEGEAVPGHGDGEDQLAPRRVPAEEVNGERVVMVAAGDRHTVALSEAGRVFTWGDGGDGQMVHNDLDKARGGHTGGGDAGRAAVHLGGW